MPVQIQLRRGTAAEWASADPILAEGEVGADLTSGRFKIGDGSTHWSSIPFAIGTDGNGILYGTAAPTTEGVDGDFYIRTTTNYLYGPKAGGVWPSGTSLVGPAGSAGVPVGGIIMWSGTIAAIPTPTWQLCDGTHNSPGPDLRDKFIVGARQDDAGVAKSNIEGTLKQSATATGASIADHSALSHSGGSVADHSGLSHDGSVAAHPDLTHAALSHPALTISHPDHSMGSVTHTHASGADVSIASMAVASGLASRPSLTHAHVSGADVSLPSYAIASALASSPTRVAPSVTVNVPSQAIASGADISHPSGTIASAQVSMPSQVIASGVDISIASYTGASMTGASMTGASVAGASNYGTAATANSGLSAVPSHTHASHTHASHTHAAATASRPSLAVAAASGSAPSGTVASSVGSRPSLAVASVAGTAASQSIASGVDVSVPSQALGSAFGSRPSITGTDASGADVSMPSQALASSLGSRPSLTGSEPATTLTHADHSLASLSHQDIGSHIGSVYGTHAFTPPAAHGTAGTLTHSFTQPAGHTISSHSTVAIVPAYFALAYIQRMS
jgi:uncharacterized protein YjbI with pentapeptide repeats